MSSTLDVRRADPEPTPRARGGAPRLTIGLILLIAVLGVVVLGSVLLGTRDVGVGTIWHALADYNPDSTGQTVIREMRVPRTLIGLTAGIALGLSGAILQASTRNPLADPGILGVNGGAAAAIVVAIALIGRQSLTTYIWFGFVGAGIAVVVVYSIAALGREGATPVKLALAGAAVSAGLYALISAIVIANLEALNEMRFWQVGSLAGRYWTVLQQTAPFLVVGSIVALFSGRVLNGLALGDEMASGLGVNVRRARQVLFAIVAVLCGAAVAACGPIVFLGLAVPQAARAIVGPDYRWVLAYTAVLSPGVMLIADIVGRLIVSPGELEVGVVLGILGAPVFIGLVRYKNLAQL
ncbi:MAG: iron ABC transporter permease [Nocardioides sp.]|uniref:FecCD family ABC transporter permease n=1 Tax=Nocardioides sp. TaxID=35761 RepID=UPI0039E2A6F3